MFLFKGKEIHKRKVLILYQCEGYNFLKVAFMYRGKKQEQIDVTLFMSVSQYFVVSIVFSMEYSNCNM